MFRPNRYAIIKVNRGCPFIMKDELGCLQSWKGNCIGCHFLDSKNGGSKNYGDTRQQFIKKIEQVIKNESLKGPIWENNLARKIVNFLGIR